MVQRMIVLVSILAALASCAAAEIGRVTSENEQQRVRFLSGPADQHRPDWAPVRPLLGNRNFTPLLRELLESKDISERARAAFLLGMLGDRDSADGVARLLKDGDRTVRVAAGIALGCLGDERGIHACEAALRADPPWLRYYSVYALWYMNTPRASAVLRRNSSTGLPFIDVTIREVLKTRYVAVVPPMSPALRDGYKPTADDLWPLVCDVLIAESDHWWHEGDYYQTIRCQEAAIFFEPNYADGYSLMSWLQWSMGDDATAIKTLNRGIQAVPESPDTWGALGQHYWMTKRYELALAPLSKSIELGADHLIRRTYAYCLEKTGRIEECLAQWEVIVKEAPNDPAAPLNLERLRKLVAEHKADK